MARASPLVLEVAAVRRCRSAASGVAGGAASQALLVGVLAAGARVGTGAVDLLDAGSGAVCCGAEAAAASSAAANHTVYVGTCQDTG